MTPEWGCWARDLPPETQFLLVQLADSGPYAVLLPLVDSGKFRVTLRPPMCAAPRAVRPVAPHGLAIRAAAAPCGARLRGSDPRDRPAWQAQRGPRPAEAARGEREQGRGGLRVGQRAADRRWM